MKCAFVHNKLPARIHESDKMSGEVLMLAA